MHQTQLHHSNSRWVCLFSVSRVECSRYRSWFCNAPSRASFIQRSQHCAISAECALINSCSQNFTGSGLQNAHTYETNLAELDLRSRDHKCTHTAYEFNC